MFKVGGIPIGMGNPPFIIAEMSGNHNQSLERALAIVDAVAAAGANALKIQTYTPDTMTLDFAGGSFFLSDPESPWSGQSLYELYQKAQTPWEWHPKIFQRAREHGLIPFSTPFDETALDFLESLEMPMYKIASFENTDLPLLRRVASTKKPMLISTGMASISDLERLVTTIRDAGCTDFVLLKCTSCYPADAGTANLNTIPHLRDLFKCEVGLSDHTMGVGVAVASVVLGACVVEKHFTLDRSEGGVDSAFSLEPHEMRSLVVEAKRAWESLGNISYGVTPSEEKSQIFRRSIYVTRDLEAGDEIKEDNVRIIRPGFGLSPRFYYDILGKKVKTAVLRGTPLSWGLLY